MYETRIVNARTLMQDDRFKVAGSMYRITDTALTQRGYVIIWANPLDDQYKTIRIEAAGDTKFKIYNLTVKTE